jgi:hypothetical protein
MKDRMSVMLRDRLCINGHFEASPEILSFYVAESARALTEFEMTVCKIFLDAPRNLITKRSTLSLYLLKSPATASKHRREIGGKLIKVTPMRNTYASDYIRQACAE